METGDGIHGTRGVWRSARRRAWRGKERGWRRHSHSLGADPEKDLVSDDSLEVVGGICLGRGVLETKIDRSGVSWNGGGMGTVVDFCPELMGVVTTVYAGE